MTKTAAKPKVVKKVEPESLQVPDDTEAKVFADLEWIKNELQGIKDRLDRSPF